MKNNLIPCVISLVFFSGSLSAQNFDKNSILEDLDFLYQSLEDSHYDLYAFTNREEFLDNFNWVKEAVIEDSLNVLQATSLFQQVVSKANTGHAEIDFPISSYRNYAMNGGTVLPLEIAIEDGKVFIRKNYSDNSGLNAGQEIVAIDEIEISQVLNDIYPHLSAETQYFKNAKLEFWSLPRLYWQVYGQKESFKISIKNGNRTIDIETPSVDLINGFELKRNDLVNPNRFLEFHENIAYLKPGNFSGDEETYKAFIDSAFTVIRLKKSDALVIDFRNNAGGHNEFSDYLVSYFADKPFKWHSKFTLKTSELLKTQTRLNNDTTDTYFKEILAHRNGERYEYSMEVYKPQDPSKRFSGDVYALINRHSYSMSAVTAAMIQDYSFGTIVGEPTGDIPSLHASQFQYQLPNTGIVVKVPKGYIVRPNSNKDLKGVEPDIFIRDHLIDDQDEILNGLLEHLSTK